MFDLKFGWKMYLRVSKGNIYNLEEAMVKYYFNS